MKREPIVEAGIDFTPGQPPRSRRFGDWYHPAAGAMQQAQAVFLAGNGLPARWAGRERFVIVETGFGFGNNFLATWQAWRDDPARCERLHIVSLEAHPPTIDDLRQAHAQTPWPALAAALVEAWPPPTANLHALGFDDDRVQLLLAWGDAERLARELVLEADALYLDGFAPDRNPQLWSPDLLKALARRCAAGATAATWSVAGEVRRHLRAVGFDVSKQAGPGAKREISVAAFRPHAGARRPPARAHQPQHHAIVVGAGLAGAFTADALVRQGWRATVVERHAHVAGEASGNAAGIFHGVVHGDDGVYARLFRAASLHASRRLAPLLASGHVTGAMDGLLRLTNEPFDELRTLQARLGLPARWVQAVDRDAASALAGLELPTPAWFHPGGGWVDPRALCRALLRGPGIELITAQAVARLATADDGWLALDDQGSIVAQASVIVLANGADVEALASDHAEGAWSLSRREARVCVWQAEPGAVLPKVPLAGSGYAIALPEGRLLTGGVDGFVHSSPALARPPRALIEQRQGWRVQTPDRLPIVGPLALRADALPASARRDQARLLPRRDGLFVHAALGSRGITLAPLCAALLAAQIAGAPLPIEQDLVDALDPGRFLVRAARRAERAR